MPWRHGWPVSHHSRPGLSASKVATCAGRQVRVLFPATIRLLIFLVGIPTDLLLHDWHWACPPDVLGVGSCLAQSPPRTLSDIPTHPAVAPVERPCSLLHRLAGKRSSLRPLSPGTSSPVGTAHPHGCPACSSQAAAGSPPSQKSRNMCGAAPLSFHPAVCWPLPAGVPFSLSGGVLARRC
jgi:hypothetical protein